MELLKAKVELFTVKLLLIRLVFYYFWFSWKPDLWGGDIFNCFGRHHFYIPPCFCKSY